MQEIKENIATKPALSKAEGKLVPQLRFKEFDGEWETKLCKDLFKNSRTKGHKGLPIYSVTLDRGMIPRDTLDRKTDNAANPNDNIFVARDNISYNMMRMWQGAYGKAPEDCMVSAAYVVLEPKMDVLTDFFVEYFNKKRSIYLFTAYSYGLTSDRLRLYFKDFARIKLNVPVLPEQQKIASFLSALDQKIQQLTKKKELLEQYKKGVMQQLFPPKGGQAPALRFKDENGNPYSDWQEKRLGEIGEFKTSSVDKKIVDGEPLVKLVNYMNVYRHEDILIDNIDKLMIVSANTTQLETSDLKKGDILFTPSSETPDDIGHSVVIFEDLPNVLYSYHLMRFRPTFKLDLMYSHFFCNTANVLRQISRFATGSTRFTISVGNFSAVKLLIPCFEEQQKIATYLSSIDTKIEQVTNQIIQTQTFKKGLLQQMFV